jgi:hypothetical protein
MKLSTFLLATGLLVTNAFGGSDGFDDIKCGSDIAKALVGKHMAKQKVVELENRHADIGLKDLGADEISDRLSTILWLICGSEFLVLEDGPIVRDAVKVSPHSKKAPFFSGHCEINGKESKDIVVAILDNEKETNAYPLPAKVAWKIDQKKKKFVPIPVEGLRCPQDGVSSEDSGL